MHFCLTSCFTLFSFFFFNDTATTEIYTLSLHDALPISGDAPHHGHRVTGSAVVEGFESGPIAAGSGTQQPRDRKSTRLNSSHMSISYAVFCLKKKKKKQNKKKIKKTEH